jgi:hypothetical protein
MNQPELFATPKPARSFDDDALGFLIKFARRSKRKPFSAEDVTGAALAAGICPMDLRAWGAVFALAAREGYIRRSDVLFKRAMGSGTLAPGWVAC